MSFPPTGWARRAVRSTSRPTAPITRRPALWVEALESRLVPTGRPLPLPVIYAGTGEGPPPLVRAFDAETGAVNFERLAADPSFAGGVRVATADITRDGFPDLVAALGPGGEPRVQVLDGKTGDPVPGPLGEFLAYAAEFTGGVQVAAADVDGDTIPDVITGAGAGGGPHVKAFSGATGEVIRSFFAFEPEFAGGVALAAADFTGGGRADLAVGAGAGGGPRVRVFDLETGTPVAGPLGDFFAFDPATRSGVTVGADALAGDVNADGTPDLAVGTGPGVAPLARVFSGATGGLLRELAPFDGGMTAGVRVALNYADDDAFADLVAGPGPGVPVTVRVFSGATGLPVALPTAEFQPFGPDAFGGVNLAASNDPPVVSVWIDNDGYNGFEASAAAGAYFRLERSDPAGALTATYKVAGGTATNGVDYTGLPAAGKTGTVQFPAGQYFSDKIWFYPVDDAVPEPTETIILQVVAGIGYTTGYEGEGYVFDDDRAALIDLDVDYDGLLTTAGVDRVANYLPGYAGSVAKLTTTTEQKMKVVAEQLKPGGAYTFRLTGTSKLAGIAGNVVSDPAKYPSGTTDNDYVLVDAGGKIVATDGTEVPVTADTQGKAVVEIRARDFGGRTTVILKEVKSKGEVAQLPVPKDEDNAGAGDGLADVWERSKVQEWNAQYGQSKPVDNVFFGGTDDKEERDPDGPGVEPPSRTAHKTPGDHIPAFEEYRGFFLNVVSDVVPGHLRLSPARKEALLEVDRAGTLTNLPSGGLKDYFNGASEVLSDPARGAGIKLYWWLDRASLPAPNFLATDARGTVTVDKQKKYLFDHRGTATLPDEVNNAVLKYFTHVVVLDDVPASHRYSSGFTYDEVLAGARNERGIYLLTTPMKNEAAAAKVSTADMAATTTAHEFTHMVIKPALGGAVWDGEEHEARNPGGNALMGDVTVAGNSDVSSVDIKVTTQVEYDLAGNPALL